MKTNEVVPEKGHILPEWLWDVWDTKDNNGVVQRRELSFLFTGHKMRAGTESYKLDLISTAQNDGPPRVHVYTMSMPLLRNGKAENSNLYIRVDFHAQGAGFKGLQDIVEKMIEAGNKRLGCKVGEVAPSKEIDSLPVEKVSADTTAKILPFIVKTESD